MRTYEDGLRDALAVCRAVEAKTNTFFSLEEIAAEDAAGECADGIEELLANGSVESRIGIEGYPLPSAITLDPGEELLSAAVWLTAYRRKMPLTTRAERDAARSAGGRS